MKRVFNWMRVFPCMNPIALKKTNHFLAWCLIWPKSNLTHFRGTNLTAPQYPSKAGNQINIKTKRSFGPRGNLVDLKVCVCVCVP